MSQEPRPSLRKALFPSGWLARASQANMSGLKRVIVAAIALALMTRFGMKGEWKKLSITAVIGILVEAALASPYLIQSLRRWRNQARNYDWEASREGQRVVDRDRATKLVPRIEAAILKQSELLEAFKAAIANQARPGQVFQSWHVFEELRRHDDRGVMRQVPYLRLTSGDVTVIDDPSFQPYVPGYRNQYDSVAHLDALAHQIEIHRTYWRQEAPLFINRRAELIKLLAHYRARAL